MAAVDWLGSLPNLVGYVGATIVAVAYFLNQRGSLGSDDWRFPGMNLFGSALIIISLSYQLNPPSVVIEVFWSAISIYGVQKNLRAARRKQAAAVHAEDWSV